MPAYGQFLSDKTGLVNRFDVETGGHVFEVQTVSNFDVSDHDFNKEEKRLTIFITSSLENNLGEIIIPHTLLSGNFTFYLNDQQYAPIIKSNEKISFITLNFTGAGNNKLDIIGTKTLNSVEEQIPPVISEEVPSQGGGCLIATATYGTELSTQVQQLREIRDQKLIKTEIGRNFIDNFNQIYYSFSPIIADYERKNTAFRESVKLFLTPLVSSLSILNYAQLDSELDVLGLGVSIISINIGIYFVTPAILIILFRKIIS